MTTKNHGSLPGGKPAGEGGWDPDADEPDEYIIFGNGYWQRVKRQSGCTPEDLPPCQECINPTVLAELLKTDSTTAIAQPCMTPLKYVDENDITNELVFRAIESGKYIPFDQVVMTEEGAQLRDFVVANADLIIGIFCEDAGIVADSGLAKRLFASFFDRLLYLWPVTNKGNVPWLLVWPLPTWSHDLDGLILRPASHVGKAIAHCARSGDDLRLDPANRMQSCPHAFDPVTFSVAGRLYDSFGQRVPRETVNLVIHGGSSRRSGHGVASLASGGFSRQHKGSFPAEKDGESSGGQDAGSSIKNLKGEDTHTILKQTIVLRTAEFRRRVARRLSPTPKGQRVIEIARKELDRHLAEHPELAVQTMRAPTETARSDATNQGEEYGPHTSDAHVDPQRVEDLTDAVVSAGKPAVGSAGGPAVVSAGGPAVVSAGGPAVVSAGGPAVVSAGGPAVVSAGGPAVDNCESYLLTDYFPYVLPSYPPFEPVERGVAIDFQDRRGVYCTVEAQEIVRCFLAIVDYGLVPPLSQDWLALIPDDLRPENMKDHGGFPRPLPQSLSHHRTDITGGSPAACGPVASPPDPRRVPPPPKADPAFYRAQYIGLEFHPNLCGCDTCGAQCHGVFQTPVSQHRIETWSIIAAMRQLAFETAVPMLPPYWELQRVRHHEHIRETGIWTLRTAESRKRITERWPPTPKGQEEIDVAREKLDQHLKERPELRREDDTNAD